MKKILSVLLVTILLIGCSEDRVLLDVLTNKGTNRSPIMYSEKGLFNGIGFDVNEYGELESECSFKNGKRDGLLKYWYDNGQLRYEGNWKDGKMHGLHKKWGRNGHLKNEENWKDGKKVN